MARFASILTLSIAACATAASQPGARPDSAPASSPDAEIDIDAPMRPTPDGPLVDPPDAMQTGGCSFSGVLATYDFSAQTGSQASTPASATATGVTATAFAREPSLTAASGSGSINSSNWPTGALDPTKYYTFTITPPTGCTLVVSALSINAKSSTTGPTTATVATSADSFAQETSISTTAASTPSITATSAGALELRVYGYQAGGTGGTMRVQTTLTVTGALQ
jgi:hypothetical protein